MDQGSPAAPPPRDRAIVTAVQRGDRAAFALLYERFGGVVHGALIARVAPERARELVQDGFAIALRRIDALALGDAVGSWLLEIARARAELDDGAPGDAATGSLAPPDRALGALRALPDSCREVVAMRLVSGLI